MGLGPLYKTRRRRKLFGPIQVRLGFRWFSSFVEYQVWTERRYEPCTADTLKTKKLGGLEGRAVARLQPGRL